MTRGQGLLNFPSFFLALELTAAQLLLDHDMLHFSLWCAVVGSCSAALDTTSMTTAGDIQEVNSW